MLIQTYEIRDYLYVPKLDGTETIHQLSGTTTISNGEMSGGSGFIGAFDNTGDWELSLKAQFSGSNCGFWIIASNDTTRDNNACKLVSGNMSVYPYINGNQGSLTRMSNQVSYNVYHTWTIRKENNVLTFKYDDESARSVDWSLINSLSTLGIGVDTWGHTATIKDIVVKPL